MFIIISHFPPCFSYYVCSLLAFIYTTVCLSIQIDFATIQMIKSGKQNGKNVVEEDKRKTTNRKNKKNWWYLPP